MRHHRRGGSFLACVAVSLLLAACGKTDRPGNGNVGARPGADDGKGRSEPPGTIAEPSPGDPSNEASNCKDVDKTYAPKIEPSNFVAKVDHPLFPLVVGATYKYAGEKRSSEAKVTPNTKEILGVKAIEVHETISEDNKVTRDTLEWYAQDKSGAVWRLGRATKKLDGVNVVNTDGSWEAGKDGAQPGVVMPVDPTVGGQWRQGYYPCHVDDVVSVLADNASINTTGGSFTECLQTHETSPLDPKVDVEKYYCKDKGLVLRDDKVAGNREGLTEYTTPQDNPFPPFEFPDAGAITLPEMPPLPTP